ncbi:glycosyl hydrolase family 3 C-terminal domain-containing protein, partial [Filobasidium floriforme]|uniref:glycosyl hydrolase family 3 C-terminal domain-containing protein n=1 Tax=Filobasidium floriforme TaxID=5210 RepID=UPI001E8D0C5A
PNARTRTVSGGGSAYLTSSYVVTAWDGIVAALEGSGVEVVYSAGCYSHRYLPLLDGFISAQDGTEGWDVAFYNTAPSASETPVATYVAASTKFRINDHKPAGLNDEFHLVGSGHMTFPHSGMFEFGLCSVGKSRLFVDDVLVVENGYDKPQTIGDTFYGLGTREETGVYHVEPGKRYLVRVEFTNSSEGGRVSAETTNTGQPSLMLAALRVGGSFKMASSTEAIEKCATLAKECDAVICVTGGNLDWETEGADRTQFALPGATDELVESLLEANSNTIICNISGSAFAFPWVDKASSILQCWLGGNETGNAMADVLFGKVNPSGRMPLSFPHEIEHCTAHLNWGSENGKVHYGEGLFVGYRGYEATKRDPMFALGEGLSYSTFREFQCRFGLLGSRGETAEELEATITLSIENTSQIDGADVVQIYVSQIAPSLRRPLKELKGFQKVFLRAGEKKTVFIRLDKLAFSYWNDKTARWVTEMGEFDFMACRSAREGDVVAKNRVRLNKTCTWTGL